MTDTHQTPPAIPVMVQFQQAIQGMSRAIINPAAVAAVTETMYDPQREKGPTGGDPPNQRDVHRGLLPPRGRTPAPRASSPAAPRATPPQGRAYGVR